MIATIVRYTLTTLLNLARTHDNLVGHLPRKKRDPLPRMVSFFSDPMLPGVAPPKNHDATQRALYREKWLSSLGSSRDSPGRKYTMQPASRVVSSHHHILWCAKMSVVSAHHPSCCCWQKKSRGLPHLPCAFTGIYFYSLTPYGAWRCISVSRYVLGLYSEYGYPDLSFADPHSSLHLWL